MSDILTTVRENVLNIVCDTKLTHTQQVHKLAKTAENLLPNPQCPSTSEFERLIEDGQLCEMGEGHAPYSARYILPDYEKFMREGSEFLRLPAPKTLYEAIYSLEVLYHNVPSVTHFLFISEISASCLNRSVKV